MLELKQDKQSEQQAPKQTDGGGWRWCCQITVAARRSARKQAASCPAKAASATAAQGYLPTSSAQPQLQSINGTPTPHLSPSSSCG